jgi:hypothetical protein
LQHVDVVAMFSAHELLTNCHPERSRGTLCIVSGGLCVRL